MGRKRARASADAAAAEQGAEEGASSEAVVSEFVGRMTREEVRSRIARAERAGAAAERGGAWGAQEEAAMSRGSEAEGADAARERYTSLPPGMEVLDSGADSGERGCFGEGDEDAPWGGTREFPAGARPRASELGASGDADWSSSREPPPEVPV